MPYRHDYNSNYPLGRGMYCGCKTEVLEIPRQYSGYGCGVVHLYVLFALGTAYTC